MAPLTLDNKVAQLFVQPFAIDNRTGELAEGEVAGFYYSNACSGFIDIGRKSIRIPHPRWLCAIRFEDQIADHVQNLMRRYKSGKTLAYDVVQDGDLLWFYYKFIKQPNSSTIHTIKTQPQKMPVDFRMARTNGTTTVWDAVYEKASN